VLQAIILCGQPCLEDLISTWRRVIGVFDSAVRISRGQPFLGRPAVEGITTLPRQNRSNNDLHGGSFQHYPNAVRLIHHALLIIRQIAQPVCELVSHYPKFLVTTVAEFIAVIALLSAFCGDAATQLSSP
jgi:hypothetical protein